MLVHRRGSNDNFKLEVVIAGPRQNATNIHIDTNGKVLYFNSMREVFVDWEPAEWRVESWHGLGPSKDFVCGVPGCTARAECMGFCKRHWTRVVRYGDFADEVCSHLQNGLYTEYPREYKSWDRENSER